VIAAQTAPTAIRDAMAGVGLPPAAVSFVVIDTVTGKSVAEDNADLPRSPASTMKVVTTFAALDLLGPAYLWHTRAFVHGELRDGVLYGDLVLKGGGDPYLTLERWWGFARQVRNAGLREIRGDIIIDDSAFALAPEDPGAFDKRPNRSYNVAPSALLVNFQSVEFHIAPDTAARRVTVTADPMPENLTIDNRIRYVAGRCRTRADRVDFVVKSASRDHVIFTGKLAAECAPREFRRALLEPQEYAYGTFLAYFRQLGGAFEGHLRRAAAPVDATLLLSYDSQSLGELIRLTNKFSNNVMARDLFLTLGSERFGEPATLEKSRAAIGAWGEARGLTLSQITMMNGSGLSREERISALSLGRVLLAAYHSPYQPEFLASLPLAGMDGTLRSRLQDAPPGSVRLKTGSLAGVSAIAGYVTAANGNTYVTVSIVNDARADSGAAESVHAALIRWVQNQAKDPGAPAPTAAP
jgi:D-alanyl-D-alanine carboxypeptidase/D-alanyl-D-alanine-endopeptidase (penicillin-binding protein 4)